MKEMLKIIYIIQYLQTTSHTIFANNLSEKQIARSETYATRVTRSSASVNTVKSKSTSELENGAQMPGSDVKTAKPIVNKRQIGLKDVQAGILSAQQQNVMQEVVNLDAYVSDRAICFSLKLFANIV